MAGKYFPVLFQGLANHFGGAFRRLDLSLFFYFQGQGFDSRQMFGSAPAPGNIL
jgi:hypothetical protein